MENTAIARRPGVNTGPYGVAEFGDSPRGVFNEVLAGDFEWIPIEHARVLVTLDLHTFASHHFRDFIQSGLRRLYKRCHRMARNVVPICRKGR